MTELADPRTGVIPDERVQPFAEIMTLLDKGEVHAEASRGLHDLTAAVADTGKAGTMTITIKLSPLKGSSDQLIVSAQVAVKPPKSEPSNGIFWIDKGGALVRNDPNQPSLLEGLHIIELPAARVVTPDEN